MSKARVKVRVAVESQILLGLFRTHRMIQDHSAPEHILVVSLAVLIFTCCAN